MRSIISNKLTDIDVDNLIILHLIRIMQFKFHQVIKVNNGKRHYVYIVKHTLQPTEFKMIFIAVLINIQIIEHMH
jgi:hypothetical protein